MKLASCMTLLLAAAAAAILPLVPAHAAAPAGGGAIEGATQLNAVDPMEASRYLGTAYKKESEGFKITPPAGSTIIERSGIDLVSFVVEAKSWSGSLQLVKDNAASLDDFLASHKRDLANNAAFRGFQTLQEKPLKKGDLPAVSVMFSMEVKPAAAPRPAPARPPTPGLRYSARNSWCRSKITSS